MYLKCCGFFWNCTMFGAWEGKSQWITFSSFSNWHISGVSNNRHCDLWVTGILSPKIYMSGNITERHERHFYQLLWINSEQQDLGNLGDSSHWAEGSSIPIIFETQRGSRALGKRQSDWGQLCTQLLQKLAVSIKKGAQKDLGKSQYYIWGLQSRSIYLPSDNLRQPGFVSLCGAKQDSSGEGLWYLYWGGGCQFCATVWGRGELLS